MAVIPIITLLTDFGTRDAFVASLKGVILSIHPKTTIIDISHEIRPGNIREAAYVLRSACRHFPKHAIHVAVVDPGVGTSRRPILATNRNGRFLAPDNGLLSYILHDNPSSVIYNLTVRKYRLQRRSVTFDGRDLFAPAAAWISKGLSVGKLGRRISDPIRFPVPEPEVLTDKGIQGQVMHMDRFGNIITNITPDHLERWIKRDKIPEITVGARTIKGLKDFYAQSTAGELSAIFNSDGYLEIYLNKGNALSLLSTSDGDPVEIH